MEKRSQSAQLDRLILVYLNTALLHQLLHYFLTSSSASSSSNRTISTFFLPVLADCSVDVDDTGNVDCGTDSCSSIGWN